MKFDKLALPNLDIKIPHKNWQHALCHAFALLVMASAGEVVCITGPSRAGKSKLIKELCALLCGNNNFDADGLLPYVIVEATNSGPSGTFSTKNFTVRLLEAIKHPTLSPAGADIDSEFSIQKIERTTEGVLRLALERGLLLRKTKYLFIDEAQHATYASKTSQAPQAVMDSWKCLAESANLILIIVGAYPIMEILRNSAHITGRKLQVHLPRYKMNQPDIEAFMVILDHFDAVLTLDPEITSLRNCASLLFEGSFGCIGLLKGWLKRATAIAYVENRGVITVGILRKTVLSNSERNVIQHEIVEGEKVLELYDLSSIDEKQISDKNSLKQKKAKGKSFKRKPKRLKKGNRTEVNNEY